MSVTKVDDSVEGDYPLLAAVNRAAKGTEIINYDNHVKNNNLLLTIIVNNNLYLDIKRHQGRLIQLEYVGEGKIDQTLLLVGKVRFQFFTDASTPICLSPWFGVPCGIYLWFYFDLEMFIFQGVTYDTGGADIKAGGVMAGMHRYL